MLSVGVLALALGVQGVRSMPVVEATAPVAVEAPVAAQGGSPSPPPTSRRSRRIEATGLVLTDAEAHGIDDASMRSTLARHVPQLRYCAERRTLPRSAGRLTLAWDVAEGKATATPQVLFDTVGDEELTTCFQEKIRRWSWGEAEPGWVVARFALPSHWPPVVEEGSAANAAPPEVRYPVLRALRSFGTIGASMEARADGRRVFSVTVWDPDPHSLGAFEKAVDGVRWATGVQAEAPRLRLVGDRGWSVDWVLRIAPDTCCELGWMPLDGASVPMITTTAPLPTPSGRIGGSRTVAVPAGGAPTRPPTSMR